MRPHLFRVFLLGALAVLPAARAHDAPPAGKLTWYGQSCFLLETAAGTRIVMDPIPKGIGYELPQGLKADVVTISHEHFDHNNVGFVTGKPRVIHGLTPDKKGWARVDERFKDVSIRSVGVYHDAERGAARGLDTVFIFEVGGVRIAHLGDLGHVLNDEQLAAIGAVDVLLVPVGGKFTIDALMATRVAVRASTVNVPTTGMSSTSTAPIFVRCSSVSVWPRSPRWAMRRPPTSKMNTVSRPRSAPRLSS